MATRLATRVSRVIDGGQDLLTVQRVNPVQINSSANLASAIEPVTVKPYFYLDSHSIRYRVYSK